MKAIAIWYLLFVLTSITGGTQNGTNHTTFAPLPPPPIAIPFTTIIGIIIGCAVFLIIVAIVLVLYLGGSFKDMNSSSSTSSKGINLESNNNGDKEGIELKANNWSDSSSEETSPKVMENKRKDRDEHFIMAGDESSEA